MLADTGTWLPIIAIGVMMYFGGKAYARFAKKTWDWSVADAVITRVSNVNVAHQYSIGATRWDNPLKVYIEYSYMVNGELWRDEHITRWRSMGQSELYEAKEFRKNNPVGKKFQLLHNPGNPFDSLLNGPRDPTIGVVLSMFGLALAAFSLINWLFELPQFVQLALIAAGLLACALAYASSKYPFERPWWFEKTSGETERFMSEANSIKEPDKFRILRP